MTPKFFAEPRVVIKNINLKRFCFVGVHRRGLASMPAGGGRKETGPPRCVAIDGSYRKAEPCCDERPYTARWRPRRPCLPLRKSPVPAPASSGTTTSSRSWSGERWTGRVFCNRHRAAGTAAVAAHAARKHREDRIGGFRPVHRSSDQDRQLVVVPQDAGAGVGDGRGAKHNHRGRQRAVHGVSFYHGLISRYDPSLVSMRLRGLVSLGDVAARARFDAKQRRCTQTK